MALTVGDIIDEIEQLGNRVDPSYRTRLLRGVNRAQQYWAFRLPWEGLKRTEDFVAPGGRFMHFPDRVSEVIKLGDIDNARHVPAGAHWENRAPDVFYQGTSGTIKEWRPAGSSPVAAQPATDTTLNIRTTASEAVRVLVRGLVFDSTASGTALELRMAEETLNMGGSGFTATSNTFREVFALEKTRDSTSDLIVQNPLNSQTIGHIPTWDTRNEFKKIEFLFPPSGVTPVKVTYFTKPEPLGAEDQTIDPALPTDFLVWRSTGDLHWIKNEREPAQVAWAKAEEILQNRINAERTFGDANMQAIPTSDHLDFSDWDC